MCADLAWSRSRARGFTLIEMIVFIVIVTVALAGIVNVITKALSRSGDPVQPKQAMLVAESMLEEILLKPFNNPEGGYVANCPAACERARFDDVRDYAGYASMGVRSLDDLATPIKELETYAVAVRVVPENVTVGSSVTQGMRITVDVSVNGATYTMSGYRFND